MAKTTKHFKNCLGVFQGGGCKAFSFVGAFRESINRGVFYSEVAGTSAGSIVAALIAAGATPEYLEEAILATDFNSFKKKITPNRLVGNRYELTALLRFSCKEKHRNIASFIRNLGVYSSEAIEAWLEKHLQYLLGITDRKVKFNDLYIPLHVVATELGKSSPAIWSSTKTPEACVSYAVRCSCTIPIYFQPVNKKYVDGGVISNLPSFVVNGSSNHNFEKLLCYSFSPSESVGDSGNPESTEKSLSVELYFEQLVSAIIDGAVTIQGELQPNLHNIKIDNLPLNTLDFHKITQETIDGMFRAGSHAAKAFFDSEAINVKGSISDHLVLRTEPETLNQIVREDGMSGDEIFFSLKKTRYVYNLFPTFLDWVLRGARITFLTHPQPNIQDDQEVKHEKFRRLVLKALGVRLIETANIPFEGVMFRRNANLGNAVIFSNDRNESNATSFAVKFDKIHDAIAIRSMFLEFQRSSPQLCESYDNPFARPKIELVRGGHDELVNRLKTIEAYKGREVNLSIEEVSVDKIVFLTKYVKSYKYSQIQRILDLYADNHFELFESIQIKYRYNNSEIVMPVTPPLAEEYGGKFFLFEGNSRLTYLIKERKAERVKLIVVRNVSEPLPTTGAFNQHQLLISDQGRVGKERYDVWNPKYYRCIEEAARRPSLYAGFMNE